MSELTNRKHAVHLAHVKGLQCGDRVNVAGEPASEPAYFSGIGQDGRVRVSVGTGATRRIVLRAIADVFRWQATGAATK